MAVQTKVEQKIKKDKTEIISKPLEPFTEIITLPDDKPFITNWKVIAFFIGVMIFVILSRLVRLGFKPPMHDECMFFFYSHLFSKSGDYDYMPILHGPTMLFVSSLVYIFIGTTDFTIRLAVGLLGIGLFGWLWGMRKYLGEKGTIFTFVFFALSPTIMYYSRFWRNDIPLEFAILGSLYCFLKFCELGKGSFLIWSITFATLAFCIKENSIFYFFTGFTFLALLFLTNIFDYYYKEKQTKKHSIFTIQNVLSGNVIKISAVVLLVLTIMKLIVFAKTFEGIILTDFTVKKFITFTAPFKYYFLFIVSLTIGFIFISLIVFAIKNNYGTSKLSSRFYNMIIANRYYLIAGILIGMVLYVVLFTTFLTNRKGFFQIYKETFGYWWGQHKEHRIKGAFHYYMPILLIYEFLPLFIVLAGWGFSLFKNKFIKKYVITSWIGFTIIFTMSFAFRETPIDVEYWDKTFHFTSPFHVYLILTIGFFGTIQTVRYIIRKETLLAFGFYWFWLDLLLYSYAGEKIPWVNVHITIPLLFTAALYMQKLLKDPFYLRSRKILIPIFYILALYTFTTSMKLCFVHPWDVRERMVYGHTTMEVKDAAMEIRRIAALLGTRENTEINAELGLLVNWPLRWYFRDYPNLREVSGVENWKVPVCFVNWDHVKPDAPDSAIKTNITENYHITKIKMLMWWQPPIPDPKLMLKIWKVLIPEDKLNAATNGDIYNAKQEIKKVYRYLLYRETFDALNAQWPTVSSQDCAFCIRKDIFAQTNNSND